MAFSSGWQTYFPLPSWQISEHMAIPAGKIMEQMLAQYGIAGNFQNT
jgi:hypothetical protein